jgi:small conductance mechanosensitive channel
MIEQLEAIYRTNPWLAKSLRILVYFLIAWLVTKLSPLLAKRLARLGEFSSQNEQTRPERRKTLQSLFASAIGFLAFFAAVIASLALFVDIDTLLWVVGLFSAAFGLGARPLISDFMTGVSFIFEDTFAVGEKVEVLGVEGVVESINLRNTWLRSQSGESYVIPNGEIRMVRNYSRGKFSTTDVSFKVAAQDFDKALSLLEDLGTEAVVLLPNLLEPWRVICKEGVLGQQAELTLLVKTRFARAAETRPRLLALVQERLSVAKIELVE